jgi:hypothetical protein
MISEEEFMDVKDDIVKWLPRYIKNVFERDEIISEMYLVCHKVNEKFDSKRNKGPNAKKKFLYYRCFYELYRKYEKEILHRNTERSKSNDVLDYNPSKYHQYNDYDEILTKISISQLEDIIKYACEEINDDSLKRRTGLDAEFCGLILAKIGSHF